MSCDYEDSQLFMSDITDKFFCNNCLNDDGLRKFFRNNCIEKPMGECDYCQLDLDENGSSIKVEIMAVTKLQEFLRIFLSNDYNNAVEELPYDSGEGGYQGFTIDAYDLLEDNFCECINGSLLEAFQQAADDQLYTNRDHSSARPAQRLKNNWKEFKDTIKHKYRFFFGKIEDLSNDRHPDDPDPRHFFNIFDIAIEKLNAFIPLEQGTCFYRCRIIDSDKKVSNFNEIGPPSAEYSIFANRFSPSGIPMFYAGCDKEICLAELNWKPKDNKKIITGEFKLKKSIQILDIASIQWPEGEFDPDWVGSYDMSFFFKDLIKDMTMSVIKDGSEHIDYIPTQIICEYLRYFKEGVEGICFPSSKNNTKKNYVFFWDCEQAQEYLELIIIN